MTLLALLLSASATAAPCTTTAQLPIGSRLRMLDVIEGRVGQWETTSAVRRSQAIAWIETSHPNPRMAKEDRAELYTRIAMLYLDEARYQARCAPESGLAGQWFEKSLRMTEPHTDTPATARSLRVRGDALCELRRWTECVETLTRLETDTSDHEIDLWRAKHLRQDLPCEVPSPSPHGSPL